MSDPSAPPDVGAPATEVLRFEPWQSAVDPTFWAELARRGIGVHCGECGGYNKTPHGVFLAWMEDVMDVLRGHGIGYALWNFRGSFGILDSKRQDVKYEDWHGHRLDRQLLALLETH